MGDGGLPCDICDGPTYMHCHVEGIQTICRDCYLAQEEADLEEKFEGAIASDYLGDSKF